MLTKPCFADTWTVMLLNAILFLQVLADIGCLWIGTILLVQNKPDNKNKLKQWLAIGILTNIHIWHIFRETGPRCFHGL